MSIHLERFANRVALITGGAAGIGRAAAERLLAEGAAVIVWDKDRARLDEMREHNTSALLMAQEVDVSDEQQVNGAVSTAMAKFGKLDILINSAGVIGPTAPYWGLEASAFRRTLDINVGGTFNVSKAVTRHLIANQYGRIVNIASILGKEGGADFAAYCASKAAVIGLTKAMARDVVAKNISVNAIAPAAIMTEIFAQTPANYMAATIAKIPMGRAGELHEAAALICWLASEECSFSTGSIYDLSGGRASY